jgi:hypothetical protein
MFSVVNVPIFNRDKDSIPMVSLYIHSELLKTKILERNILLDKLLRLATFPFIKVVCSPTDDYELIKKIQAYEGVIQTSYKYYSKNNGGNFYTLLSDDFEKVIAFGKKEDLNKNVNKNILTFLDLMAGEEFDYFIVNDDNPLLKEVKNNTVNSEYCLELIRLLLVNNGIYYVDKNMRINEGYYYIYRFKSLFHGYQKVWSIVVAAKTKSLISDELFEQFSSLSKRLEFACRAYDKLSFYDLKPANNDTQDNTMYHFSYLIMLITGIFDDLAWIIKHLYTLNLSRMEIGLKIPKNNTSSKFYKKLAEKNHSICQYLLQDITQIKIKLFYPLRDSLQHREFLRGLRYKNSRQKVDKNLFLVPREMADLVVRLSDNIGDYGFINLYEDNYYLDTHLFSYKAINLVAEIVNDSLSLLDLGYLNDLLGDDKVENSDLPSTSTLGKFFGWHTEPIYF